MLKISKLQIDHLKTIKVAEFCKKVHVYLQNYYERELFILGEVEDQMEWVEEVVSDAQSYGMDEELDIYTYARVAITFDEDFHELAWANKILQLKAMPSTKAQLLEDAMSKELDKMLAQHERDRDRLLEQKVSSYSREKASYVFSFNIFYGLGLENIEEAEKWLYDVAKTAVGFGFTDDFLLDSYLEVALYFGKDCHTREWARDILESDKSVTDKISALLSYLSTNFGNKDARK